MQANISKLSRLTSGEISPDQAVVDYFYYDKKLNFKDLMAPGFFDKISGKFQVGTRMSVYCLGDDRPATGLPPSLNRFDVVVGYISDFSPPRSYKQVTLLPGVGTWRTQLSPAVPGLDPWAAWVPVFQGFINWTTPAVVPPGSGINAVIIENLTVDIEPASMKITFNQPEPGDLVFRHMVQSVTPQANNTVYVLWAPITVAGPPVAVEYDPPAGQLCEMFITIWANIKPTA